MCILYSNYLRFFLNTVNNLYFIQVNKKLFRTPSEMFTLSKPLVYKFLFIVIFKIFIKGKLFKIVSIIINWNAP